MGHQNYRKPAAVLKKKSSFFCSLILHFICCLCVKNQGCDEMGGKVCVQLLLRGEQASDNELCFPSLSLLARSYAGQVVQVTCLVCRETVAQLVPVAKTEIPEADVFLWDINLIYAPTNRSV